MSLTCPRCGRLVRVIVPKGGDGSREVFVNHTTRHARTAEEQMLAQYCLASRSFVGLDAEAEKGGGA